MSELVIRDCKERVCGMKIVFVLTTKGRQMPVDLMTCKCAACGHPYSDHKPLTANVSGPCAQFRLAQVYDMGLMVPHFSTCQNAKRFRRVKGGHS